METIEMMQWVCYATSIIACTVLAVYFLRKFLNNKKLKASLWWATGFSLSALGILVMSAALHVLHEILVMLAFTLIAASVAFLYYAASTLFFCRRSFFKEIFTAILFVVSFALFLLPEHSLQGERTAGVIGSPTMVLFVVAFLALAVIFNRVVKEQHKRYYCKRLVALKSLTLWMIAVWSLYIASFWGSITVVGLVFVSSLVGFIFLWHSCRGGDHMEEEDEKFWIQSIDGVEYKIKRKADIIRERLHDAMQKIGTTLLYTTRKVEETGIELLCTARVIDEKGFTSLQVRGIVDKTETYSSQMKKGAEETSTRSPQMDDKGSIDDKGSTETVTDIDKDRIETVTDIHTEEERKNKMVTYASTIGMKEDELVVLIVKLMENICGLARSAYRCKDPYRIDKVDLSKCDGGIPPAGDAANGIPLGSSVSGAGEDFDGTESAVSVKIEKLATLAFFRKSTDRDMIETCYELVIGVCDMENDAVTKIEWEGLPEEEHPGGMIGHTYDILRCYDWKMGNGDCPLSQEFKKKFQGEADKCLSEANALREFAFRCKVKLPATPNPVHAKCAIEFLKCAIYLFQKASDLIKEASQFPENPPGL